MYLVYMVPVVIEYLENWKYTHFQDECKSCCYVFKPSDVDVDVGASDRCLRNFENIPRSF
jgi:hypothetical protein